MKPLVLAGLTLATAACVVAAEAPTKDQARAALRKATTFYRGSVARNGGYVYQYSGDLALREGEGIAPESVIWVQPPGTPAVGEAFLDAYAATGDALHLDAARGAGEALVKGQLRTGGWYYHIEFDPAKRSAFAYRDQPEGKKQNAKSTLDDDTTTASIRFLARLDKALEQKNAPIHEATVFALDTLLKAQRPNGGWHQWWDAAQPSPKGETDYPVKPASYPETWPRQWGNDWTGRYYLNDNVMANVVETLLLAHQIYGGDRYLAAAEKAGDFLILAQMPEPQPAWAQQYDRDMHPVWDRKFEPPAVSGSESQDVIRTLMDLYRATRKDKYLAPIPKALAYLKKSKLDDGRLSRFYELKTNRPLYLYREGGVYHLTYTDDRLPDHYSFKIPSRLDALEREYAKVRDPAAPKPPSAASLAPKAAEVIAAMDPRGAWVERKKMRHHKMEPPSGVIDSATFIANIETLCRYLSAP